MSIKLNEALAALPPALAPQVTGWLEDLSRSAPELVLLPEVAGSLPRVWVGSEFVARQCLRHHALMLSASQQALLLQASEAADCQARLQSGLAEASDEAALFAALRRFRQREMVRILWRDLAGWAQLEETCRDLSQLAEVCIQGALDWLYPRLCQQFGTPYSHEEQAMQLVVLGMGKFGAWELNVSSDIDLIFAYEEDGETRGAARSLSHSEFFMKLGQKLIAALDKNTADGFVFRVDMRLRPFGDGGPLVASFDALETYYQVHGREWERYAMIKARVVAGDTEAGQELMRMLQPFVYRRYLDYGAYESLREMKAMIAREVRRKGMQQNVKLGPGGIREIEFIGQVFQLIRGGRDKPLQERRLLVILERLAAMRTLPEYVVKELREAYIFLRNTEHRIQGYADQQTHMLPDKEPSRTRLAFSMGYADWAAFLHALEQQRQRVQRHFEQVFEAPQSDEEENDNAFYDLWHGHLDAAPAEQLLTRSGYRQAADILARLQALQHSRLYHTLSSNGRLRLDRLMPLLLGAALQVDDPDTALLRVLDIVQAIARRSVYLALLVENPLVLSQLVKLCHASPWLTRYLARYPLLLDELMDVRSLHAPSGKADLAAELAARMAGIEPDDHEQAMDALRHFKHINVLRVAAADISGVLPLMKVSDHLSWIAEVLLQEALGQAWRHLVGRHGRPPGTRDDQPGFAVIAYGKLGGLELGYGSDLDLVFLHGGEDQDQMTDGASAIAVPVFYARLGQRLIHILTTHTPAGVLYEVDMRLRPDGASGMLVSNLAAFAHYQSHKAWLWEHQALVRARGVAGDAAIIERFTALRREVLGREREREALREEVRQMRLRMRKELSKKVVPGQFDLKQGEGGMVDIEFLVQYFVLGYAHPHPDLATWPDNIRILDALTQTGLLEPADTRLLADAYRAYRSHNHRQALQEQPGLAQVGQFEDDIAQVRRIWNQVLETDEEGTRDQ